MLFQALRLSGRAGRRVRQKALAHCHPVFPSGARELRLDDWGCGVSVTAPADSQMAWEGSKKTQLRRPLLLHGEPCAWILKEKKRKEKNALSQRRK